MLLKNSAIISGITGYIGSSLARFLLKNNWKVFGIIRQNSSFKNISDIKNEIDFFVYDNDFNALKDFIEQSQADIIFHLAAAVIGEHSAEDVDNIICSNVLFGSHILEAMCLTKTKLMINTGTIWQHYGGTKEYNPVSLYAATKQAFIDIIKYYTEAKDLRIITLKLFDVYGINDPRNKIFSQIKNAIMNNFLLPISSEDRNVDFIYIDDVVNAYLCAYDLLNNDKNIKNDIYFVNSGFFYKLKYVLKLLEKKYGKPLPIKYGARKERLRENNLLYLGKKLPNWQANINIDTGLDLILQEWNREFYGK